MTKHKNKYMYMNDRHSKDMTLIVSLEPGRGIDKHVYREDTVAAAYS